MLLSKGENLVSLIVNSQDRSTNPGNTNENFSIAITQDKIGPIKKWAIGSVTIPYSWYSIDSTNNVFEFIRGPSFSFTLSPGNYTYSELATALQTGMNTLDANAYTVTYNTITSKFTIAGAANFTMDFTGTSNMKKVLGFPNNSYTGTNSYTASNVAIISNPFNIIITSDKLRQITTDMGWVNINGEYIRSNVITNFLVNGDPGNVMTFYNSTNDIKWHNTLRHYIHNIDFQLRDGNDYNKIMDLNGVNWLIEIIFELDRGI